MVKYKIVLVPFPFDDLTDFKIRPAICLTEPIGSYKHIIIAFISSKMPEELLSSDLIIATNDVDFNKTGLLVDSVIRLHKLVTIPKSLIKREIGNAGKEQITNIKNKINELFN